jgi:hypothetical protein
MNGQERIPVSPGMKLTSLLLVIGGVWGIGIACWIDIGLVNSGRIFSQSMAIAGAFIVLSGWAAWTGRDMWLGYRRALPMAQILFALQIPLLRIPGFFYEFHTGVMWSILIMSGPRFTLGSNLGSSFNFYISPETEYIAIGINLFAVFMLIYLMRLSREFSADSQPGPPMHMA